ncbi:MAG: ABC transporter ATP-binding protein [Deltaproteobacteria bacterium]|jgi:branched-chain amino acid transport system ATP-binding protein
MLILEGKSVVKHFGGLVAAAHVDFHVDQGEIVGLIGPNGAGKTTLFNLISGSLAPTSGSIGFKGENITGLKPHEICKRGIARTFQLVKLFGNMTVLENVLFGSMFGKMTRARSIAEKESSELLEFVGLSGMDGVPAKELSLANQKRLEIARAMATKADLLLLDEVMAGLNPSEVDRAVALVKEIRNKGITVFMIEHVMKAIMGISDRIIVLHFGTKIAEGTPDEIATDKKVIEVYLGLEAHAES